MPRITRPYLQPSHCNPRQDIHITIHNTTGDYFNVTNAHQITKYNECSNNVIRNYATPPRSKRGAIYNYCEIPDAKE